MLAECRIREETRQEVYAGRRVIYTRVPAISWFNLCDVIIVILILRFVG